MRHYIMLGLHKAEKDLNRDALQGHAKLRHANGLITRGKN